ncbi:hypothetical protein NEOKW01_1866 [Nematocida sp. AWRm80]|nr:hypothetical protein NEOKW01_1866 [Nematocida sp. AWRm80]
MEFGEESDIKRLEKEFNDSIEYNEIGTGSKKQKAFTPFRTKYDQSTNTLSTQVAPRNINTQGLGKHTKEYSEKLMAVEKELSRLKEMQSKVLGIQESIEESIELKKSKDKELRDLKAKYKARIHELEQGYKSKEKELKQAYDEKTAHLVQTLKEKFKDILVKKVAEETEKLRKEASRKIFEIQLKNKTLIDKLSQMYMDLKQKYKQDIQKIDSRASLDRQ